MRFGGYRPPFLNFPFFVLLNQVEYDHNRIRKNTIATEYNSLSICWPVSKMNISNCCITAEEQFPVWTPKFNFTTITRSQSGVEVGIIEHDSNQITVGLKRVLPLSCCHIPANYKGTKWGKVAVLILWVEKSRRESCTLSKGTNTPRKIHLKAQSFFCVSAHYFGWRRRNFHRLKK